MKTTINRDELKERFACSEKYETFVDAHGGNTVNFSDALTSTGWHGIWWLIVEFQSELSDSQKKDVRLLACDYAEAVLHLYERKCDDSRPRNAIQAGRDFANGLIDDVARNAAWAAARAAVWDATASDVAWAAARAAVWPACKGAVWSASGAADWAAGRSSYRPASRDAGNVRAAAQELQLKTLFEKWESENV